MSHTVLARKWRPKKFSDLVGQHVSVTVLNNILASNRLHHAYLLTGTRGIGKTTIARIIAKALNCQNPQNCEPCCSCQSCIAIDQGNFVDVIEIDAASNTGVDNIRELIDNAQYAPISGKYKVYIIDEVHMLSKSAFNAMLKTLEEPPEHVIFILATTDLQKVPITILSRCLQLKLRNLLPPEITEHLIKVVTTEKISFEEEALKIIADAAHGSMRDALSILDQAIAYTNSSISTTSVKQMLGITDDLTILAILDALNELNSKKLNEIAEELYNQGRDLENVLLKLSQYLTQISLEQLNVPQNNDAITKYSGLFNINDVQLYFEICNLGLEQIKKTNNKFQVFIMTLFRMLAFNIGSNNAKIAIVNQPIISSDQQTQEKAILATTTINQKEPEEKKQSSPIVDMQKAVESEALPEPGTSKISASTEALVTENLNDATSLAEELKSVTSSKNVMTKQEFDGNWTSLIENIEENLDHHIRPFVENAKLIAYDSGSFKIAIDDKYQNAFNNQVIEKLNSSFSNFFKRQISFAVEFITGNTDTLKEKRQILSDQKQQAAEYAIKNDPNLAKFEELFSATIAPNSIKPL